MPDRPDNSPEVKADGPGVQLRRARKKRGLLLHDIAQELHLDEWMLQALEEDDFAALGAPVFAKGHMRKYGDMLGLNSDDLMIAYYRKRGRDDSPPPITHMMAPEAPRRKIKMPGLSWLVALLVAAIVLSIGWVVWSRYQSPDVSSSTSAVETTTPQITSTPAIDEQPDNQLADPLAIDATVNDPATESTLDSTLESAKDSVIGSGGSAQTEGIEPNAMGLGQGAGSPTDQPLSTTNSPTIAAIDNESTSPAAVVTTNPATLQVRLNVSGESWVEVTDSDGKRLVYDMLTAGRSRTVTGRPPIEIFLGNSRSVQVIVDGDDFSIPRRAVRGNTARFVIGSDSP